MSAPAGKSEIISRLAPTPSGYLHLGNAFNFLLTWLWTRHLRGTLWLRIDDHDRARSRPEFIADIFETLDWLGLDWDRGPRDQVEFQQSFSQGDRYQEYFRLLDQLPSARNFACGCSRKEIHAASPDGRYPGTCRKAGRDFEPGRTSLRFLTGPDLAETPLRDFILWRRDNQPAYQLVSVAEDIKMETNLIIRGEDLYWSSRAQLALSQALEVNSFRQARFYHHPLVKNEQGKLSKSLGSWSLREVRRRHPPGWVYRRFADFAGLTGSLPARDEKISLEILQKRFEPPALSDPGW